MVEINPEVLNVFGFWGSILVFKLMLMVPLTARQRFGKKVFASPEDTKYSDSKAQVRFDDPDVERVRRAHLNDLENILPWFIITYLWIGTGPSPFLANTLIRTFVLARIVHTFAYTIAQQQPMRAIGFFIGYGIVGYEALSTLLHYF